MANFSLLAKIGVDTKAFSRGLKGAQGRIKAFSSSAIGQFAKVGAAFAGIGLIKSIGSLGVAAAETASKFKAVFGPATASMNKEIEKLRQTIPSTKAEMQDALSTFASMAKAFGLNEKAASMFSVEMVKVAGDIASFHNLPIEETFTKIRSAISGEFEPMKQLGIVINEARLKQEALNLGIFDGVGQMNAAQKALAVQSIMIRDLGDANGDAASTANSTANQIKFLKKELAETGTQIGTTLLPAIATLTSALSTMLTKIVEGTEGLGEFIGRVAFMGGMSDIEFQAKMDLQAEGAFEGLKGRGGAKKIKAMIQERVKEIEAEKAARKKAEEDRKAAREKEIKESDDLGATLGEQIKTETDPIRAQALKDRLAAYQELIKAAGDLEGIEASTTEKIKEGDEAKKDGVDKEEEEIAKSSLTGHDLRKAGNIAGKKEGIRFEKFGNGGFQEFINGRKGRILTEEQMQVNLQKQIDKDPTESLLEKINSTLEGKFVSQ
jgi:hypothetical protein